MKVKEIVARVRSAIDEQMANDSDFLDNTSDEENLTMTIIDKIGYALAYILENAPEDKLASDMLTGLTTAESTGITVAAGECVKVKLPSDVLRVVSARLSSWSLSPVPVTEFSQEYQMQQDDYARGSWDRPVNAIVYHGKDRYLEMYSAKAANDEVEVALVRKPVISDTSTLYGDQETEVTVPVRLEGALIYHIAGLTMVAFREEVAASLFTIARQHLTGINE